MTLVLPVILPLLAIILMIFFRNQLATLRWFSIAFSLAQLLAGVYILAQTLHHGHQVLHIGSWQAPYGITFVADILTGIMLTITALVALLVMIYSLSSVDSERQKGGFFILAQGLLMGVNGAFLTGDIFNLYVWFEVMLTSSFVLITLGATKEQLRGSIKYVVLNLIASVFFVAAIGLMYGKTGTLNMADLAFKLRMSESAFVTNSSFMLFFIAFSIKAGLFPFFFWLPASYHTPPVAITALFAGTLTKVGVYVMIRFYSLFIVHDLEFWRLFLLIIAGLTMVSGVLMAASQYDIRKILSFHIISQIGYMVMGLGLFTIAGITGAIYFMVHNILSKTSTFLAGGLVNQVKGSYNLKKIGGLYKTHPLIAVLFFIPALSLAGLPILPGFFGKLYLIVAGFQQQAWYVTAFAIAVSLITLFSMIKIWNEAFWKIQPEDTVCENKQATPVPKSMIAGTLLMVLCVVLMGVFAGPLTTMASQAAAQIIDPTDYIRAVLNY